MHHLTSSSRQSVGKPLAVNLPELGVTGAGRDRNCFDDAIYTGAGDGRIVKVSPTVWQIEVVADTQGRPLEPSNSTRRGCSSAMREKGLLLLRADGLTTLVGKGEHGLRVCNNAAVGPPGRHRVLHRLQPALRP